MALLASNKETNK